jgi:hypothetical protein
MMTRLIASVFVLSTFASIASAHAWRGITPMRSTHEDVERLLGVPEVKWPQSLAYTYDFPEEFAVISFQSGTCEEYCGPEWNIAVGTVMAIGVIPKRILRRDRFLMPEFQVENRNAGFIYLRNERDGLTLEEYKGTVTLIIYSHKIEDTPSRCARPDDCIYENFPAFDEYGDIRFADEKARLDNFAFQLQQTFSRGSITVYGPNRNARTGWLSRAARAKKYVMKLMKFSAARVLVVDGGYSSVSYIRLKTHSMLGGYINIFTEKDPVKTPPNKRL